MQPDEDILHDGRDITKVVEKVVGYCNEYEKLRQVMKW